MAKLLTGTRIYGTATVDTQLFVSGTNTATSTSTGALQVFGGVGIGQNLYVGSTNNAISTSNAAAVFAGGVGIGQDLRVGGIIYGAINGTVTGIITSATNIAGGTAGQVPYQTGPGATSFFGPGSVGQLFVGNGTSQPTFAGPGTAGQFLKSNGAAVPTYVDTSTMYVGYAATGTNLNGGNIGSLPYQNGVGSTVFLGIGSPGQLLIVNPAGTAPAWASTGSIVFGQAANVGITNDTAATTVNYLTFVNTSTGYTGLRTAAASGITYVPNTGNVGIGIETPDTRLRIVTTATGTDGIYLSSSIGGTSGNIRLAPNMTAGVNNGIIQTGDSGLVFSSAAGNNTGGFIIAPVFSLPNQIGGLRISNLGFVGINVAAPTTNLQVAGTWTTSRGVLNIDANTGERYSGHVMSLAGVEKASVAYDNTDLMVDLKAVTGSGVRLWSNNQERMRISNGGDVGINTSTMAAKLDVAGTGRFTGIVTIANSTVASSTITGALIVQNGGLGVGGLSYFGGGLNMANTDISAVNKLTFSDPGPNEGLEWVGGNNWKIYESPDDLATNSGGNLQFVEGSTRRFTVYAGGGLVGVNVAHVQNSTAVGNGALVVSGGASIASDLRVGGTIYGTVSVTGSITTASNLAGGSPGQVVYQVASGQTGFSGPGSVGQVLTSNGTNGPVYVNTSSLYVGNASVADAVKVNDVPAATAVHYITFANVSTGSSVALTDAAKLVYQPSTGNVGINQSSPASKLDVSGTVRITGVTTVTNVTASTGTSSGALIVAGGVGVGGDIYAGGGSFDLVRVAITNSSTIDTVSGNLTIDSAGGTTNINDNVIISGTLTVQGVTTVVDSTVTNVADPIITIGGGPGDTAPTTDDNKDRGIAFKWHNGTNARTGFFGFDDSTGFFTFISSATISNEVVSPNGGTDKGAIDAYLAGGATGSLPYQSAANLTTFLPIGSSGTVLTVSSGGLPQWSAASGITAGNASTVAMSNDVSSTTPQFVTFVSSSTGALPIKVAATNGISYIPSSGNFGLGINNPAAKLDIANVPLTAHGLQVTKSFAGGGDSYTAATIFGTDSGVGNTGIEVARKGTGGFSATDGYALRALYNGGTVMAVQNVGRVGINTATPIYTLDTGATGSIRAGGRAAEEITRTITTATGDTVAIGALSNNSTGQLIKITITGHNSGVIDVQTYEIGLLAYAGYANGLGWLELPKTQWSQGWLGASGYCVDVYRPDTTLASAPTYFRVRNKTGVGGGTVYITFEYDSDCTFTPSTVAGAIGGTFNATTAPASGSTGGYYGALEWYWPVTGSSGNAGGYNAAAGGLYVKNDGSVGIGTTTPSGTLEVVKNQNAQTAVYVSNSTAGTSSRTRLILQSDAAAGNISVGMHSSTYTSYPNEAWVWASGATTPLIFGTVGSPRMRIDTNGNVLIGTSASLFNSAGRGTLEINGTSNAIVALKINNTNGGYVYHDGTNLELWNNQNGQLKFGANNTLRLWMDSSGRLTGGFSTPVRLDSKIKTDDVIYWSWQDSVENGGTGMSLSSGTAGTTATFNTTVIPFSKAMTFNGYYEAICDEYIPVTPGETVYGELWAYRANAAAGVAGAFYAGVATYDKDKRQIDANLGLSYFVAAGVTVPTTGVWTKYSGTYTAPLTHTPYLGSDGGPIRYIRPYIIVNYTAGTIPTSVAGYIIRRRALLRDTGDAYFTNVVKLDSGVNATSTATGALQVINGGVGIGKDLWVGGNIYGTLASPSPATNINISDDPTNAATHYPVFSAVTTGNATPKVDSSGFAWVPSTNRLGIGTASPSANLHAKLGATGEIARYEGTTGRYLYNGTDALGHYVEQVGTAAGERVLRIQNSDGSGNYTQLFWDGANRRIYTDATAFVGIGTSTPAAKFTVFNSTPTSVTTVPTGTDVLIDSNTNSYLTFRQTADTGIYGGLQWVDNNVGAYIVFRNYTASGTAVGSDSLIYGSYQDHIFQTGSSATVNGRTEQLRIIGATSKVGIGTPNAGAKLSIYNSTNQPNGSAKPGSVLQLGQYLAAAEEGPAIDFNLRWSGGYEDTNLSTGWVGGRIAGIYDSSVGNGGALTFWTNGGTGASGGASSTQILERMRIRPDGNVGIGLTNPSYKLQVNGSFAATTKSFVIPHPTKPGKQLRYGSLEGPENGVYVRGKLTGSNVIELPDYWTALVDPDSITVTLTPIGKHQKLYVEDIKDNKVFVGNDNLFGKGINCFYTVWAERADVEKLEVEVDGS